MRFISILILFTLIWFDSYSQTTKKRCGIDFPSTVCEKEEINGDITITWKTPVDQNGVFLQYELYSKESPFSAITTINSINNNSVTIPSIYKGNNFYLVTSTLCNNILEKFSSDTTQLTILSAVKIDEGTEKIFWQKNLKYNNNQTFIERKTETGPWTLIDSLNFNSQSYFDTVDICNKNKLYYRIGIKNNECISYSSIISDTLKDSYHPNIPKIVALGFDTTNNNLILSWKKTKEKDIQGIIIYQENNGISTTLDTLLSINNKIDTFYTLFNPSSTNISNYRIAAFDYCYSIAPKFQTSAQSTSFFTTIINEKYNVCTREINLNWNNIITDDEIIKYKIYKKEKNNNWKCIDSTINQSIKIQLSKFTLNNITVESTTSKGYKFFSNILEVYSKSPSEPIVSYTNYATINNDHIEIKHTLTPISGLSELALFKKNELNKFVEIERKVATDKEIIFTDYDVKLNKNSYEYYIQHIDSCMNYTKINKTQKTILINENYYNEDSLTTSFIFSKYEGFTGQVNNYIILRSIDDKEYTELTEIYTDSIYLFSESINPLNFEGKVCYKILAKENQNIYNNQSTSLSNTICFYINPRIYIPTAFTPNGINPVFIPVVSIAKIDNYEFTIFNRWGQPVFNSKIANEGWNGRYGNEDSPNGLYVYQIKINAGSDKEIIKRGFVNLIR